MATEPTGDGARPTAKGRGGRRAATVVAGALVVVGGLWGAAYAASGISLPSGTTIAGVQVGGLSPAAAEEALRGGLAERASSPLTLRVGAHTVSKSPADLGLAVDYTTSVARAGGAKTANPVELVQNLAGGRPHDPVVSVDADRLGAQLAEVASTIGKPIDAGISFDGLTPRVTPGEDGFALKEPEAADAVKRAYPTRESVDLPATTVSPDITTAEAEETAETTARAAVSGPVTLKVGEKTTSLPPETIAGSLTFAASGGVLKPVLDPAKLGELAQEPVKALGLTTPSDAVIRNGPNGPVIVPSVDGVRIAPEALADAVLLALASATDRSATVNATVTKPAFTTEDATKLGVKEVTGEFTTYFPGTYAYRYVNIPKAAGIINNTLVMPGQTFSLNESLGGQRTAEKGWASGFGIADGKETMQLGGGLSQITTTLYNAVFFAGLEDVQHKPHSLWFSRYPKGREATLSWPDVDLKFRNDSAYGVLIQSWTTGHTGVQGSVTVRLWSTKVYDVKQANTVTSNYRSMAGVAATPDPSPNCIAQPAQDGFDIRFDRQFWQNGKLVKSIPYFWHYNTLAPTVCTASAGG